MFILTLAAIIGKAVINDSNISIILIGKSVMQQDIKISKKYLNKLILTDNVQLLKRYPSCCLAWSQSKSKAKSLVWTKGEH